MSNIKLGDCYIPVENVIKTKKKDYSWANYDTSFASLEEATENEAYHLIYCPKVTLDDPDVWEEAVRQNPKLVHLVGIATYVSSESDFYRTEIELLTSNNGKELVEIGNNIPTIKQAGEIVENWFNKNVFNNNDLKTLPFDFFEDVNESVFNESILEFRDINDNTFFINPTEVIGTDKSKYTWSHTFISEPTIVGTAEEINEKLPKSYYMLYTDLSLSIKEHDLYIRGLISSNNKKDVLYTAELVIVKWKDFEHRVALQSNLKDRLEAAKIVEDWFDKNVFNQIKILPFDFFESKNGSVFNEDLLPLNKVVPSIDPDLLATLDTNKSNYYWRDLTYSKLYTTYKDFTMQQAPAESCIYKTVSISTKDTIVISGRIFSGTSISEPWVLSIVGYTWSGSRKYLFDIREKFDYRDEAAEACEKWFDENVFNQIKTLPFDFFEGINESVFNEDLVSLNKAVSDSDIDHNLLSTLNRNKADYYWQDLNHETSFTTYKDFTKNYNSVTDVVYKITTQPTAGNFVIRGRIFGYGSKSWQLSIIGYIQPSTGKYLFDIREEFTSRDEAAEAVETWFDKNVFKIQNYTTLPFDFFESTNGSVFNEELLKFKTMSGQEFWIDNKNIIGTNKKYYTWSHDFASAKPTLIGTAEYLDAELDKTYYMLYSDRSLSSFKFKEGETFLRGTFLRGLVVQCDSNPGLYNAKLEIINHSGLDKTVILKHNIKTRLDAAKFIEDWFDKNIFNTYTTLPFDFFENYNLNESLPELPKNIQQALPKLSRDNFVWSNSGANARKTYDEYKNTVNRKHSAIGVSYQMLNDKGGLCDLLKTPAVAFIDKKNGSENWRTSIYVHPNIPQDSIWYKEVDYPTKDEAAKAVQDWFDKNIFTTYTTLPFDFFEGTNGSVFNKAKLNEDIGSEYFEEFNHNITKDMIYKAKRSNYTWRINDELTELYTDYKQLLTKHPEPIEFDIWFSPITDKALVDGPELLFDIPDNKIVLEGVVEYNSTSSNYNSVLILTPSTTLTDGGEHYFYYDFPGYSTLEEAIQRIEDWFYDNVFTVEYKALPFDFFESFEAVDSDSISNKIIEVKSFEFDPTLKIYFSQFKKSQFYWIDSTSYITAKSYSDFCKACKGHVTGQAIYTSKDQNIDFYYITGLVRRNTDNSNFIGLIRAVDTKTDFIYELTLDSNFNDRFEACRAVEKWFDENFFNLSELKPLPFDFFEDLKSNSIDNKPNRPKLNIGDKVIVTNSVIGAEHYTGKTAEIIRTIYGVNRWFYKIDLDYGTYLWTYENFSKLEYKSLPFDFFENKSGIITFNKINAKNLCESNNLDNSDYWEVGKLDVEKRSYDLYQTAAEAFQEFYKHLTKSEKIDFKKAKINDFLNNKYTTARGAYIVHHVPKLKQSSETEHRTLNLNPPEKLN